MGGRVKMEEVDKKITEEKESEDKRCFVMMPISNQGDYPLGHFDKIYEQIIQPAIKEAGYMPYRVDENKISDAIIDKIFKAVQNCEMAICDLSNRNPNVLYELGLRQAYNRPVVLMQDEKTEKIFDVGGISTIQYRSTRLYDEVIEDREKLKEAILATKDGKCNTLVKIVKTKEAINNDVKVSKEDKVQVILEELLGKVTALTANEQSHSKKVSMYSLDSKTRISRVYNFLEAKWEDILSQQNFDISKAKGLITEVSSVIQSIDEDDKLSIVEKRAFKGELVFLLQRIKNKIYQEEVEKI